VRRLAVLDIAPTLAMYERTDMAFARAYYHWFFLIQPAPFPETLINHDRGFYLRAKLGLARANPFDPAALAEYLRCYDEATVHASCEDYRAAAGIDLEHDRADRAAGRRVRCPVLALWGRHGVIERCYRPLEVWREYADEVSGRALEAGHYLAEEVPDAVYDELVRFFGAAGT
jgi:haloacetate dehalogenase